LFLGKDYDEFRNFVSVSQLKPTSGRELSTLFRGVAGLKDGASSTNAKILTYQNNQVSTGGFDELIRRRKNVATLSNLEISSEIDYGSRKDTRNIHAILPGGFPSKGPSQGKHKRTTKNSRGDHDFLREWREQCKDSESSLLFLTRANVQEGKSVNQLLMIPGETCDDFFSTDMESTILGGVVDGLHLFMLISMYPGKELRHQKSRNSLFGNYVESRTSCLNYLLSTHSNIVTFIRDWLIALTKCGRFDLNMNFLARDRQDKLVDLCNFVRDSFSDEESISVFLKYETALR